MQDAITRAGMVWHGMEIFTASTRPTVTSNLDSRVRGVGRPTFAGWTNERPGETVDRFLI